MRRNSREGCIEAREIELTLKVIDLTSAIQVGRYRIEGVTREIASTIGLEIEGDGLNMRHWFDFERDANVVKVYDDWVQPTRR